LARGPTRLRSLVLYTAEHGAHVLIGRALNVLASFITSGNLHQDFFVGLVSDALDNLLDDLHLRQELGNLTVKLG